MHELPLVFFTVFVQSAVGAFILLMLASRFGKLDERRLAVGLCWAMGLFVAGLLASALHLGQPLRALYTLARVGPSPMSNEIVLVGLFAATGGVAALGLLLRREPRKLFTALGWIASLVGVGVLVAIPAVYHLATVVTWNTPYTPVVMLLTALIGGGIVAAALGVRAGLVVSLLGILTSFAIRPGYVSTLMNADGALTSLQQPWFTAQTVLLAAGVVGALFLLRKPAARPILLASAAVIFAGELAGRIAFYNLWTLPM